MRSSFTEMAFTWAIIAIFAILAFRFGPAVVGNAVAHEAGRSSGNITALAQNVPNPFDALAKVLRQSATH
jgi:hypothetical protein